MQARKAKDPLTDMSRLPTLLFGTVLLCGVAWMAVTVDEIPAALIINAGIADLLGQKGSTTNYADTLFVVLCVLLAAGIGAGIGWSLRGVTTRAHETELQRHLNETKGKIPRLESGMRNKEMHVARVEQQMKDLEAQLPPLRKTIEERDMALRDRDRTVSLLKSEVALLKGTPLASEAASSAMATLDLDDDTFTTSSSQRVEPRNDAAREALEERVRELETKVREREARIAELMYETGNHAKQIPQLESALDGQRKKNEDYDRERQRQDKWLDVLNDQLARARETNDRLAGELRDKAALQQRIDELEAEVKRLGDEIADRERRLATSRFECATARTTIAHLQAQIEGQKGTAGAR